MKRRNFLQGTLTALAATSFGMPAFSQRVPTKKPFKVNALETRYKERITIADAPISFKLLSSDTENSLSVFISTNNKKGFGPPLHLHHGVDEFFYVLDGKFLFQVDNDIFSLENGDSLFIPRKIKHCFTYKGETSGTLLVSILPGKGMENYFAEMGALLPGKGIPDMKAMQALYWKYDSEIVGPPMK